MEIEILKSKIHRATVTDCSLHYEGSITIDEALMKAAGFYTHQKVHVFDVNNGNRFETYVIKGRAGSGDIIVNGAAARLVKKKDLIIIVGFGFIDEKKAKSVKPKMVKVDSKNKIIRKKG